MQTRVLTAPREGAIIFSPKWGILCKIISISDKGFRFYVYNGDWYGKNYVDHTIVEVRAYLLSKDEHREKIEGFVEVVDLTEEDRRAYYYRGGA